MTQHDLIIEYIKEHGSILPAKEHGFAYKEGFLGSQSDKRCREMRSKIKGIWENPYKRQMLRSEKDGRFTRYFLLDSEKECETPFDRPIRGINDNLEAINSLPKWWKQEQYDPRLKEVKKERTLF